MRPPVLATCVPHPAKIWVSVFFVGTFLLWVRSTRKPASFASFMATPCRKSEEGRRWEERGGEGRRREERAGKGRKGRGRGGKKASKKKHYKLNECLNS